MSIIDSTQERRDFFRLKFDVPVRYKSFTPSSAVTTLEASGVAKDVSSAGILFHTNQKPPDLSSILWLNLDYRMLKICQEIDHRALVLKDGILGRVVRVEENPTQTNAYDIGVCFLTKDQSKTQFVQNAMENFAQSRRIFCDGD